MRVLVSRTDRIGDVVLSTPVLRALKQAVPEAHVAVLARRAVHPLLAGLDTVDELLTFDPAVHRGGVGIARLARTFRDRRFDAAVMLYSEPVVAWAALLARIPVRIGPRSKPHSFLCYNRGIRQRRSRVEKHEAEYNLDLLAPLGMSVAPGMFFPEIALGEATRDRALAWLAERGWMSGDAWVAIHPGMGGSALNWPVERYLELASGLRAEGCRLLVTTGPLERALTAKFKAELSGPGVAFYEGAGDEIALLAAIYERMSLVIAPSTGPLHLAVAVGAPVLSFYPNLRVQSPARWGPYAADRARVTVLTPSVDCESDRACMSTITVAAALAEARRLLRKFTGTHSSYPAS